VAGAVYCARLLNTGLVAEFVFTSVAQPPSAVRQENFSSKIGQSNPTSQLPLIPLSPAHQSIGFEECFQPSLEPRAAAKTEL